MKKENGDLIAKIKEFEKKEEEFNELVKSIDHLKQENLRILVCCLIHSTLSLYSFVLMG
jgi:hypothetical protein